MDRVQEGLDPAVKSRVIIFEADVTSVTPFLKLTTGNRGGSGHMSFVCDEGPSLGGLGSAPTPVTLHGLAVGGARVDLRFWRESESTRWDASVREGHSTVEAQPWCPWTMRREETRAEGVRRYAAA